MTKNIKKNLAMYEILEAKTEAIQKAILPLALFRDEKGKCFDLEKLPHLLTAGCSISGREGGLHAFIVSLLHKFSPDELKFLMIDDSSINLLPYNNLPHMLCPVIQKGKEAMAVLEHLRKEMDSRYRIFSKLKVKRITDFNSKIENGGFDKEKLASLGVEMRKMPYIVCVIDEYMPLIRDYTRDFTYNMICFLQVARASGIHIILSTTRPSLDVVKDIIKINMYSFLCFKVVSSVDSKQVLGEKGAENLQGKEALFKQDVVCKVDIYCPNDEEIEGFLKNIKGVASYDETFLAVLEKARQGLDPMLKKAIENILNTGRVNLSSLKKDLGLSPKSIEALMFKLVEMKALGWSYKFSAKKDALQKLIDEDKLCNSYGK